MLDTICAISTPPGRSALGLIRISGPLALSVAESLGATNLSPRVVSLSILKDSKGKILDEALVTFFKSPSSFTGEDLVEISAHGSPAILDGILSEIVSRETIRLAEPGEFTARALANEKLSIDQVESLSWILNAQSIQGARLGLQAKISGLGNSTKRVSERFLEILSDLQSQLDFSDHEVGDANRLNLQKQLTEVREELAGWLKNYQVNRHLFEKRLIVLAGPPNSGKSSLFNLLIGQDKAIVFDRPGTTRDCVEHAMEFGGVAVLLVDTAGIRAAEDAIEQVGVKKTLKMLEKADVILWVDEGSRLPSEELKESLGAKNWVFIRSKSDLSPEPLRPGWISASVITGDGVNEIERKIAPQGATPEVDQSVILTSTRQGDRVAASLVHLNQASEMLATSGYLDMVTEQVLLASKALAELVDPPDNKDVLKSIFARFCIGK